LDWEERQIDAPVPRLPARWLRLRSSEGTASATVEEAPEKMAELGRPPCLARNTRARPARGPPDVAAWACVAGDTERCIPRMPPMKAIKAAGAANEPSGFLRERRAGRGKEVKARTRNVGLAAVAQAALSTGAASASVREG